MSSMEWKAGDWAIYRKQKHGTSPGPRAHDLHPATAGDTYAYVVDKYWIVESIMPDGTLQLRTRRGKRHTIAADDPHLRKPHWWERWLFASRFQSIAPSPEQ